MNKHSFFKLFTLMIIGIMVTLSSCDNDDGNNTGPVSTDKTTGFILSVSTSEGNLVKYFETLPTGTADVSDGFDFVNFNPQDIFNGAIYLQNPNVPNADGGTGESKGLVKLVVNEDEEFEITDEVATLGRVTPLAIRDAETGIYSDLGKPETITVFNPTTMTEIGTINMSEALHPREEATRYRDFFIRENLVFTPLGSNASPIWYDPFVVHIADIDAGTFVGDFTLDLGGPVRNNNFFAGNNVDENGNLYITEEGDLRSLTPARLHRINSGETVVDSEFELDIAGILNSNNFFYRQYNSFFYIGNGEALVLVTADTPAEVNQIVIGAGGIGNIGQEELVQINGILSTAENAVWCVLNVNQETVTPITGVPAQRIQGSNRRYTVTEFEGKWYMPVDNSSESAYYSFDPTSGTAVKAFDVTGGDLVDFINLANNN
ncbi:MAG: hypothetical protein AAF551_00785 [Bacteroidota bacterium]